MAAIASIEAGAAAYEARRAALVWNARVPGRRPRVIVAPENSAAVAQAVADAIDRNQRVSARSGGHNWLGASLRDGATLVDLSALTAVEVDPSRRVARAGPAATHALLAAAIVPHGLAFPIGHCPTVGLGGYLLAGGAGWNMHAWGPGCWNVVGADIVDAEATERFVDAETHPDLLWALRGGGAAFPGVVTRFHLNLQPLPLIRTRRLAFPAALLPQLLPWLAARLQARPPGIEISVICRRAAAEGGDVRAVVAATGFGDDGEAAADQIAEALGDLPFRDRAVFDSGVQPAALDALEGEGGWTKGYRYAADTAWVGGDDLAEIGRAVAGTMECAPSRLSRAVLAFGLMAAPELDTAFTRMGLLTVNLYGTWRRPEDDTVNVQWVRDGMSSVAHLTRGHYVGESDLSVDPLRVRASYPPDKWERLQEIQRRWDPRGRFHSFLEPD